MKFPWTKIAVIAVLLFTVAKTNGLPLSLLDEGIEPWNAETKGVITERLEQINFPFQAKYTPDVFNYIKRYTTTGYRDAEHILGRTSVYFPIFEHYLSLYQLPQELKYLPMVESALIADIRSSAGAAGLWQLVPVTARYFDLDINGNVDERLNPYEATEAAVKLLAYLYREFQDWALVLAAYNCGAGKVQKAIRQARCNNYWDISSFLPQESRNYVPAFMAATYLFKHFDDHGLSPKYPSYDMQHTEVYRIYDYLRLYDISQKCGLNFVEVKKLNPGYINNYIPKSTGGNLLVLPASANGAFQRFLAEKGIESKKAPMPEGTFKSTYKVVAGDRLETLAMLFNCSLEELMAWNGLRTPEVVLNQSITVYFQKNPPAKP
ncbi:MAG: transglycosylase SLT domain-containing protein [Saprospiraceae bacterium]